MWIQQPAFQPDFSRLRKAILCDGERDILPMAEFTIWPGHKRRVLGRPVISITDACGKTLATMDYQNQYSWD